LQILIRNIDRALTQPEIVCHFRKYGRVRSCEIVKDPKTGLSKGFGFAEMPKSEEALKAIEELNGMKLGDSVLRVKRAANSTVSKKEAKQPPREDYRKGPGSKGSSRFDRSRRDR
jgi:RNA recognition motif-containing protein